MKTVLLVLGGGAIVYGAFLIHKRSGVSGKTSSPAIAVAQGPVQAIAGGPVVTGPAITTTAGSAVNNISPVERFAADPSILFPPMTIIQVPGAGSLDNIGHSNMHPIVQF